MKPSQVLNYIIFSVFFVASNIVFAQITPGIYFSETANTVHELKVAENYLIHTVYEKEPAKFIKTTGGFYETKDGLLTVSLEFNSDFEHDKLTELKVLFDTKDEQLTLKMESPLVFKLEVNNEQALDGQWLFGTRGPDRGQKRRGEANARKTLKFLQGGRFQWIAYDTEGMAFKGTGGGSYSAQDGIYTENIQFFSRDNSRVGASLEFNYEIKGDDWHHTGKNSKGEPMYEIWGKRN
jgi:hypothetical protein